MTINRIVCPICQNDDQIGIVSNIVYQGTKRGVAEGDVWVPDKEGWGGSYQPVSMSHVETTDLAKMLAPPTEPIADTGFGCVAWGFMLMLFPTIFLCYLPRMAMSFVSSQVGMTEINQIYVQERQAAGITLEKLILIIWVLLFVWFVWKHFRRRSEGRKFYAAQHPQWQQSMQKWQQLYYCGRNGIVFIPNTGEYVEALYIHRLL